MSGPPVERFIVVNSRKRKTLPAAPRKPRNGHRSVFTYRVTNAQCAQAAIRPNWEQGLVAARKSLAALLERVDENGEEVV